MGLTIYKNKSVDGVKFRQGHFYTFKYNAYENDPNPIIVFINAVLGIHPNTGHQHRYIQGINTNYLPRPDRKEFVRIWKQNLEKNSRPEFTWKIIERRFPYMKFAIRRYLLKPNYYIRKARAIDVNDLEKEIVKSWHKDFSSSLKRKVASRLKSLFVGKRKGK